MIVAGKILHALTPSRGSTQSEQAGAIKLMNTETKLYRFERHDKAVNA